MFAVYPTTHLAPLPRSTARTEDALDTKQTDGAALKLWAQSQHRNTKDKGSYKARFSRILLLLDLGRGMLARSKKHAGSLFFFVCGLWRAFGALQMPSKCRLIMAPVSLTMVSLKMRCRCRCWCQKYKACLI